MTSSSPAALSASRAKDFITCPLKFRFAVVDKIPEPPSLAALKGTLVHSVLENLHKIDPSKRSLEQAQDSLSPLWEELKSNTPNYKELLPESSDEKALLEDAKTLIGKYFCLESPAHVLSAHTERYVRVRTASGLNLHGYIDRIDKSPQGIIRIVDYKTGKSPAPQFSSGPLYQMKFYALLLLLADNIIATRTQLFYLGNKKTLYYDPNPIDIDRFEISVHELWQEIKSCTVNENFSPRRNGLCANYCFYKSICPLFGNESPKMDQNGALHLLTVENSQ